MNRPIYLDYAAATPVDEAVKRAMEPYFSNQFYNPSAIYIKAREVRHKLEGARRLTARMLSVKASEITFTAGATEANNLAIQGVMRRYPGSELLISSLEHDSVYEPAGLFSRKLISLNDSGIIKIDELEKAVSDKTVLVSVIMASHELGVVQPLNDVSKVIAELRADRRARKVETPLYLHTDASQAGNCLDLSLPRLGVDMASLNGGKIYGPKQSGVLYVNKAVKLNPLILGGGQEGGLRSGTENVAGAIGFAQALNTAQNRHKAEFNRIKSLRIDFANLLQKHRIQAVINGSDKNSSPHILSVTIKDQDNERLMMEMDERGIICAVGSACSADAVEPSRTLKAIGLSDEQAQSTLRFSFGRRTSYEDIVRTAKTLAEIVNRH